MCSMPRSAADSNNLIAGSVSAVALSTAVSPRPSAMWMHASWLRSAPVIAPAEVSVPAANWTPGSVRRPGTLPGSRARIVIWWPSSTSRRTT